MIKPLLAISHRKIKKKEESIYSFTINVISKYTIHPFWLFSFSSVLSSIKE